MLAETQWAQIFTAAKKRGARWADIGDVDAFKREVEGAIAGPQQASPPVGAPATARRVSPRGIKLMHDFEGCRLDAYPDPGSADGNPWTIGYGSTGPGIAKGMRWTQQQADERFAADLDAKYGKAVNDMVQGVPTTQNQFDALVSLCYNIGIAALRGSTVMRKHKAGDYLGASRAFVMWNKNNHQVMKGLTRRRLAEADLYLGGNA